MSVIWIVDDDEARRAVLAARYRAFLHPVRELVDIDSFIDVLAQVSNGDLVLLDMQLPYQQGGSVDLEGGRFIAATLRLRGCTALIVRLGQCQLGEVDRDIGMLSEEVLRVGSFPQRNLLPSSSPVPQEAKVVALRYLAQRNGKLSARKRPLRPAIASLGILLIGWREGCTQRTAVTAGSTRQGHGTLTAWLKPAVQEIYRAAEIELDAAAAWRELADSELRDASIGSYRQRLDAALRLEVLVARVANDAIADINVRDLDQGCRDFVLLFESGALDFSLLDPWFSERSGLCHQVLSKLKQTWGDPDRLLALFRYWRRPEQGWSADSRSAWNEMLPFWQKLTRELPALLARMQAQFRPLRPAETLLRRVVANADDSIGAANDHLARTDRHVEWRTAVGEKLEHGNMLVSALFRDTPQPNLEQRFYGREGRRPFLELARTTRSLHELVSARGYFNHGPYS